ncbi:vWA domain-containing protein [Vibrio ziniensis]|uniref:VWA domain-containing protein n=1 Tax=Vibrio ziniensis TaxID=2711221 RepID=A0A6G7CMN7_9VIBR|nr:VWA domain-containing protein [Vibrio ziniensis]QIH43397.1 VWA domain-containing protein [Vibrio ziniensis]
MSDWQLEWQYVLQFHFLRPWWLLTLIPLAIIFYLRWKVSADENRFAFFPAHLRNALTVQSSGWTNQLPLKMLSLLLILSVLICAGPAWQRQASPFGEDSASLMILLDNSESMQQKDVAPSRLERAKHKITDLTQLRAGGKTGLMVYAGSSHVAMPLTKDNEVIFPYLSALSPDIMPLAGKAPQTALPLLAQQIEANKGNTILLVTDGVDSNTVNDFTSYFKDRPHQARPYQLLILAVGNPDVATDSPMDIASLQTLAAKTDGKLIEMSIEDADVMQLNSQIERFMLINSDSSMPWQDEGYRLLYPLVLLMLLWFRKGWLVKWSLVLVVSMPLLMPESANAAGMVTSKSESAVTIEQPTIWDKTEQWWVDLWLTPDQQAQRLFNRGDYKQAAAHYQKPLNKGIAYYYAGEFKLAHSAFMQDNTPQGFYYAASALARQREYVAARALLRQLNELPELESTLKENIAYNLKVITALIDEINDMSKSQANSMDMDQEVSIELPDNQPQTADGADENTSEEQMKKQQLSADQILGDPKLAEVWLKRVEADPSRFLQSKFQIQYNQAGSFAPGVEETKQ